MMAPSHLKMLVSTGTMMATTRTMKIQATTTFLSSLRRRHLIAVFAPGCFSKALSSCNATDNEDSFSQKENKVRSQSLNILTGSSREQSCKKELLTQHSFAVWNFPNSTWLAWMTKPKKNSRRKEELPLKRKVHRWWCHFCDNHVLSVMSGSNRGRNSINC